MAGTAKSWPLAGTASVVLGVAAAVAAITSTSAVAAATPTTPPPGTTATTAAPLTAIDMAAAAGIARMTNDAYGNSMVFDYNKDGISDLLLSRHQLHPAELFRGNADHTFTKVQQLPVADHHYCDSADFNGDGRPDFFCMVGADGGHTNNKANQLWLQNRHGGFYLVPGAWGAADPSGRGRDVAAFDANRDGRPDLFLGNGSSKKFHSQNRLLLNEGRAFVENTKLTSAPRGGGICVSPADYNGDGWPDIFVCGRPNHLYTSVKGVSYTDDADRLGLTTENDSDAQWGDLNGDGKLDLVTVSDNKLRVWLRRPGGFTNSYKLSLQAGRNAAIADLDRDGHQDIYVVQGRVGGAGPNIPDLLLLGAGNGSTFTRFKGLPQATSGGGNEVSVIPSFNGRPALVVTNGADGDRYLTGPRQLIVFHGG